MIKDVLGIRTLEEFLNYFKIQSPEELEWYQLPLLAEKRKTVEKLYKEFTDYRDLLEIANSLNRTLYRDACNYIPTIASFQIPVALEYSNKAKVKEVTDKNYPGYYEFSGYYSCKDNSGSVRNWHPSCIRYDVRHHLRRI